MATTPATTTEGFLLPPRVTNARGQTRRAGFEFEFSGVDIQSAALIVRRVFGGGDHVIANTYEHRVETEFGEFDVLIDTSVLTDRKYEAPLRAIGLDLGKINTRWVEEALLGVASTLVPAEVSTPPIPIDRLAPLDELRQRLRDAGARGTRASVFYAFGLHINPEIPGDAPAELLRVLRAFLLLYPWLKQRAEVDVTRQLSPYINPFPAPYARLVLHPSYDHVDAGRLIDDYLEHNPTRNRPLDLFPVLACLDEQRVMALAREQGEHGLVKPRPAFHYRLPNCMVDEEGWTVAREWNTWVAVERLADDEGRLRTMGRDYLRADEASLRPFYDRWPGVLERYMREG